MAVLKPPRCMVCAGCMSTRRPSIYNDNFMTYQFYQSDSTKWFQFPRWTSTNTSKNQHWGQFSFSDVFSRVCLRTSCGHCCCSAVNEAWIWSHCPRHSITYSLRFSLQPLPLGVQESHALWLQGYCIGFNYVNVRCSFCCSALRAYVRK